MAEEAPPATETEEARVARFLSAGASWKARAETEGLMIASMRTMDWKPAAKPMARLMAK